MPSHAKDAAPGLPFTAAGNGVRLAVRLTPRAHRNAMDGVETGADGRAVLRLRIAAPPVEGAANAALLASLAAGLAIRKSDLTIRSGQTGRLKIVHIGGDPEALAARLMSWIEAAAKGRHNPAISI
jgi:uncharacterized protein (TIGR00251 family)